MTSHSMQKSADTVGREITKRETVGLRMPSVSNVRRKKKGHIAAVCKEINWLNTEGLPMEIDSCIPEEYAFFEPTSSVKDLGQQRTG